VIKRAAPDEERPSLDLSAFLGRTPIRHTLVDNGKLPAGAHFISRRRIQCSVAFMLSRSPREPGSFATFATPDVRSPGERLAPVSLARAGVYFG
jgi:hypothetical protein